MNQEIKTKWVDALRSGKYKQGKSVLKSDNNEYCCLGVLCEIYSENTGTPWEAVNEKNRIHGSYAVLPMNVVEWAGIKNISEENPIVNYNQGDISLAGLNDSCGRTFNQIADIIEQQL